MTEKLEGAKGIDLCRRALTKQSLVIDFKYAPVAQLDRVPGFEPGGREFESLRARQINLKY